MLLTHGINPPVLEDDQEPQRPPGTRLSSPACHRCHRADDSRPMDDSRPTAHMMALTRGASRTRTSEHDLTARTVLPETCGHTSPFATAAALTIIGSGSGSRHPWRVPSPTCECVLRRDQVLRGTGRSWARFRIAPTFAWKAQRSRTVSRSLRFECRVRVPSPADGHR
jgi:hypothetical protein